MSNKRLNKVLSLLLTVTLLLLMLPENLPAYWSAADSQETATNEIQLEMDANTPTPEDSETDVEGNDSSPSEPDVESMQETANLTTAEELSAAQTESFTTTDEVSETNTAYSADSQRLTDNSREGSDDLNGAESGNNENDGNDAGNDGNLNSQPTDSEGGNQGENAENTQNGNGGENTGDNADGNQNEGAGENSGNGEQQGQNGGLAEGTGENVDDPQNDQTGEGSGDGEWPGQNGGSVEGSGENANDPQNDQTGEGSGDSAQQGQNEGFTEGAGETDNNPGGDSSENLNDDQKEDHGTGDGEGQDALTENGEHTADDDGVPTGESGDQEPAQDQKNSEQKNLFTIGYVKVQQDTVLYQNANLTKRLGTVAADGILWAKMETQEEEDEEPVLCVRFDTADSLIEEEEGLKAYLPLSSVTIMTEDEQAETASKLAEDEIARQVNDIWLPVIEVTTPNAEEDGEAGEENQDGNARQEEESAEQEPDDVSEREIQGTAKTAGTEINIRKQPTTKSKVVKNIAKAGREVQLTSVVRVDGETWYGVVFANKYAGYIRGDLLILSLEESEELSDGDDSAAEDEDGEEESDDQENEEELDGDLDSLEQKKQNDPELSEDNPTDDVNSEETENGKPEKDDLTDTENGETSDEELGENPEEAGEPVFKTYNGADYTVLVSYGPEAGLPENVDLSVKEIEPGTEKYEEYWQQAVSDSGMSDQEQVAFLRFFDISFFGEEGTIEPEGPVSVQIVFQLNQQELTDVNVLHYTDDGVSNVDDVSADWAGENVQDVSFEVDGFSVFAVMGLQAAAATTVHSGKSGGCTWTIDSNGVLTIRPTKGTAGTLGVVTATTVWNEYKSEITEVVFENGVSANANSSNLFNGCYKLKGITFNNFNTAAATNMQSMFEGCIALEKIDVSGFKTPNVTNMAYMFNDCSSLTSLELDTNQFMTDKVTNMAYMFNNCSKMESLDVSGFNTINAANMSYMFSNCHSLEELNLSNFNMRAASNVTFFFRGNEALRKITVGENFSFKGAMSSFTFPDYGNIDVWKNNTITSDYYESKYTSAALAEAYTPEYAATYVYDDSDIANVIISIEVNKKDMNGQMIDREKDIPLKIKDKDGNEISLYYNQLEEYYTTKETGESQSEMILPKDVQFIRVLLPLGSYTLQQEDADDGYLASRDYPFELGVYVYNDAPAYGLLNELKTNNKYPTTISLLNTQLVGRIDVWKTDITDIQNMKLVLLKGAKFEVWNVDEEGNPTTKAGEGTSNEEGKAVIENLALSRFILKETEAPEGYELNDTEYLIDFNATSKNSQVTIVNKATAQTTLQTNMHDHVVIATLSVLAAPLKATAALVESGTCGGCTWTFYEDGLLTIAPTDGVSGKLALVKGATHPKQTQYWNKYKTEIKKVVFEDGVIAANSSETMFDGCTELEEIDFGNFDTSNTTSMYGMLKDCQSLKRLDLSNLNTSNVASFRTMFYRCYELEELILPEHFVTSAANATDAMYYMFEDCTKLKSIDGTAFDTQNVGSFARAFYNCSSLTDLDVSNWNTANVTTLANMFNGCEALTSLDVSNWNTSKVTTMANLFNGCTSLTDVDVMGWDVSKVTSTANMFNLCKTMRMIDISGWQLVALTNECDMFANMSNLETLKMNNTTACKITDGSTASRKYDFGIMYNYNLKKIEAINSKVSMSYSNALGTAFPDGIWLYQSMAEGSTTEVNEQGETYNVHQILSELMRKTTFGSELNYLPAGIYTRTSFQSQGLEKKPLTDYIIDKLSKPEIISQSSLIVANNADQTAFDLIIGSKDGPEYPITDNNGIALQIRFKDAAIDVKGDRHDLIITVKNVHLINEKESGAAGSYRATNLFTYDRAANYFSVNNRRSSGASVKEINVDVEMKIDGVTDGTFLFYATDIDYMNNQGKFEGNAEGVIFGSGFKIETISRPDEAITQWAYHYKVGDTDQYIDPSDAESKVGKGYHFEQGNVVPDDGSGETYYREYYENDNGVPNWLIGTKQDAGTNMSGFYVAGEAKGATFTWTAGAGCGTIFLGGGGVTVVTIGKQDQDGEMLADAHLQLHDETGNLIGEWDSSDTEKQNFILNSGLYRLSETFAPGGRTLADDIWFRVNPDGTISISTTGKDGRFYTQENAEGSALAALTMVNQFATIQSIISDTRIVGDIEIVKRDGETGKLLSDVTFKLEGVPDISGKYQYVYGVENTGDTADVVNYYFPNGSNIGFPRDSAGNFLNFSVYKLKTKESKTTDANGYIKFTDIPQGIYVLSETTRQAHYRVLEDRYWVKIDDEGKATLYRQNGAGATTVTMTDTQLVLPDGEELEAIEDNKTITNQRERRDLVITKTVSGNMGSRAKYFKVTIFLEEKYESWAGNQKYKIDLTGAEAALDGHTNPTEIIVSRGTDGLGKGSAVVWIRHDQTITVKDLPYGIQYTVSEDTEGYTATWQLDGGATENGSTTGELTLTEDEKATVAFNNHLETSVPTGVKDSLIPAMFGGMIVLLLAMLLIEAKKRMTGK